MLTDRMFVNTKVFDRLWESLGGDDDDLSSLQKAISDNPYLHPIIKGTGGVRKIRIALEGRGKSGVARVIYGDFPEYGVTYLFAAYPKSVKDDISDREKQFLKAGMNQIKENWRENK